MPVSVYSTGATEGLIMGLYWYWWVFIVLILILMISNILWFWYWWCMGPCSGYWRALRSNGDLGLLGMRSGRLQFEAMDYVAGVFNDIGIPMSWIQRSPDSFRFGALNSKIFMDTWGIATDPKIQQGIKVIVNDWNKSHPENDQIADYQDLFDRVKDGKIDDPITIPAVFEVPLYEIERFLQKIGPGDLEGHISERVQEETDEMKGSEWPRWMKVLIILECVIFGTMAMVYLLFGGS